MNQIPESLSRNKPLIVVLAIAVVVAAAALVAVFSPPTGPIYVVRVDKVEPNINQNGGVERADVPFDELNDSQQSQFLDAMDEPVGSDLRPVLMEYSGDYVEYEGGKFRVLVSVA